MKTFAGKFLAAFIIAPKWKQPKGPLTGEQMNEMHSVHLMGYYLAVKRSDLPTQPPMWVNLENVVPGERNHSQKAT